MNPVNDTSTITTAPCTENPRIPTVDGVGIETFCIAKTGPILVGPENSKVTCPFCSASVLTRVKYTDNSGTHIAAAIWGRLCCCFFFPYCSDDAKNADHYCPSCQKYLGTYRRF